MYAYPPQAAFGRPVPKATIYQHAHPSRSVRQLFVDQVSRIVWQYKLSPETINLPARSGISEIQVFSVALKAGELHESVLRSIDIAIITPIFFEVSYDQRIQERAAFKRPSEADASKRVVGDYYHTVWESDSAERIPLPVSLDLAGLYEQMLRRLMPLPPRAGEPLKAQAQRLAAVRSKEEECRKLTARLKAEKQFNRKVELNGQLRTLQHELERLTG